MGRFLMLQKPVFVRYCVEVWVFPERPLCGEEHCVTALKMAVERTSESGVFQFNVFYCM